MMFFIGLGTQILKQKKTTKIIQVWGYEYSHSGQGVMLNQFYVWIKYFEAHLVGKFIIEVMTGVSGWTFRRDGD